MPNAATRPSALITSKPTKKPKPELAEAVPRKSLHHWKALAAAELPPHILASEGFAAAGGVHALFDEMEEKDGHLFAVLQTRRNGVLAREHKLLPASESDADRRVAAAVREILDAIPRFPQTLSNILDAVGRGISVQEIMWTAGPGGRVAVTEIKPRHPGRFAFDERGRLRLNPFPGAGVRFAGAALPFASESPPLPDRKFLVMRFGAGPENPYGRGLLARAFWAWWFKKNNLKFWNLHNEKFGMPTAVATYGSGAGEEERARLLEILESLQSDTGVVIPANVKLEFLEAARAAGSGATAFRELADWLNDEMSKLVLGATLTSSEGRRSGSLALGEVHSEVRNEYIESDARELMSVVNDQLIRWIVDFNFGPHIAAPRWVIDTTAGEDRAADIAIDQALVQMGVPLAAEYFYERYRRPAPRDTQRPLRYDDNNLFQYHLRYGVLTINEVRETLGLPKVPWGETRAGLPNELHTNDPTEGRLEKKATGAERDPSTP